MLKKIIVGLPLLACALFAQSPEEVKFYKLDFVLKELDGHKVLNSRAFSMTAATGKGNSVSTRTGTRVPFPAGSAPNAGFQYVDIGVNIDCKSLERVQQDLAMYVSADISSTPPDAGAAAPVGHPVIRQNRWTSTVVVPLKKPTVIFSSDDLTSKRQMQLELTATPIS